MKSFLLKNKVGRVFRLFVEGRPAYLAKTFANSLKPLKFDDDYAARQFIRGLDVPAPTLQQIFNERSTSKRSGNSGELEGSLAKLLVSQKVAIYPLSSQSPQTSPYTQKRLKAASGSSVQFVSPDFLINNQNSNPKTFSDVKDAVKFIDELDPEIKDLNHIADELKISRSGDYDKQVQAIAEGLVQGKAVILVAQENKIASVVEDTEAITETKKHTLGPETVAEEVIKVKAKLEAEYKVVLFDKQLSKHQESTEDKVLTGATYIELSLEQDRSSPTFDKGATLELSGTGKVEAYSDDALTTKFNFGSEIPVDKIAVGKNLKLWLVGKNKGKFKLKLTPAKSSNGKFVNQPAAELEMGVAELALDVYEQDLAKLKKIQVDPDVDPISDYHKALDAEVLPDQIAQSEEDKIKKGRLLHAQNGAHFGRSKLVLKALVVDQFPAGCDNYQITLNTGGKSGSVKIFDSEFDGSEVPLPLSIKKSDLSSDKTYWVEGGAESDAFRDTILDVGLDRAPGGQTKTAKKNADWARFTVIKIDEVVLNYTPVAGEAQAWDSTKNRFYINLKKGDVGKTIKVQAKLSKALENVNIHFMLVEDKDNRKQTNWGVDLPDGSNSSSGTAGSTWVWKDIDPSVKHLDKTDRKDLLHYAEKTDAKGHVSKELKLSQFGGDKFYLAAYIEQDPHLAKYTHDHSTLGKRKPVMAAAEVNIWREFWYQEIKVSGIASPSLTGAIGQYSDVRSEMADAGAITISRATVNGYTPQAIYPRYMIEVNGGNADALVVSDTNKAQFFTGVVAEKDKPIKIPILICDAQWDAGANSGAASAIDNAANFPIDINMGTLALDPPLQGGHLLVSGDWIAAEKDPATGTWLNARNGNLANADISINPGRGSLYEVTIGIPAGVGAVTANTHIQVQNLVVQGANGPYLGESFNQRILAVYDATSALTKADFQNTIAHEIGHAFKQVVKGNPAAGITGLPSHPHQMDLGQGNHCRHLVNKCVMYDSGPIAGSLNQYCDVCHPYLLVQDMTEIV